ncbi:ubiquitin-like domain-containing protein [Streptomyces minutiscleroticus]|uniref:ubiquitin-like domain-containing protein n=1 Tax=Streptomyces minutiscleroticus TaxID=68238 RepID=UPI0027E4D5AF|nr:ubiquitin-like domain-containing protein [Streptomyces minutiscleroticus]
MSNAQYETYGMPYGSGPGRGSAGTAWPPPAPDHGRSADDAYAVLTAHAPAEPVPPPAGLPVRAWPGPATPAVPASPASYASGPAPAAGDPFLLASGEPVPAAGDPFRLASGGPALAAGDPFLPAAGEPALAAGDSFLPASGEPVPAAGDPFLPAAGEPAPVSGGPVPVSGGRVGAHRATRRHARSGIGVRPGAVRRLLPRALVVVFLAGGTTAFVADDKEVELTVDGEPRTLHTFSDDIGELLAEEGVETGAHDAVSPALGTALTSGDDIAVRYGRPLRLTLDGHRRRVWTTARTVGEALRRSGVRTEGAYVSVPLPRRIGREGLALDVRTERTVTVMADGRARTIRTNAATVREAVEEAGVTLRGEDATSVPQGSFPRDGQVVTVLRITGTEVVREEPLPFAVVRTEDPALFRGTEVVDRAGRPGARRVTYALRTVNGVRQQPRRLRAETVREPEPQRVRVGTRPLPDSVAGADGLDWDGLARCESGGRPDAVDPSGTYGGLYQFDTRTWQDLGGSGRPQDASADEQTFRAKRLYVRRGASPWPHCGARLHG